MYSNPQTTYRPRLCDVLEYGFDLGLNDYPIYDEQDRDRLNQAIVDHFYFREIAYDTPAMFVYQLNRRMREQMPQINKVHDALLQLDPWTNSESESESDGTSNTVNSTKDNAQTTSTGRTYNTNAPQVSMVGKDEINYYDTGAANTSDGTSESQSDTTTDSSNASKSTTKARTGWAADAIAAYYEGYNNSDLMVFDALEVCFSHMYNNDIAVW